MTRAEVKESVRRIVRLALDERARMLKPGGAYSIAAFYNLRLAAKFAAAPLRHRKGH